MKADLYLPLKWKEIVESDLHFFDLIGGRLGGKTKGTVNLAIIMMLAFPDTDVIFGRASYGSMADSSYAEFEAALSDLPEDLRDEFELFKSPLRIVRKGDHGTVYFIGYGGSNMSRTKSIHPKHKISCVVLEETQELREKRNLDEALASFRRNYGEDVKQFILGNPPPQEAHWFNKYIKECRRNPDHLVMEMTWQDILPFINDYDLKEILRTKHRDPNYYEWFYMGKTTGGFGAVYPMFRIDKHVISAQTFNYILENTSLRIIGCLIGGDGAVNNDCTAFTPLLILNNGQLVAGPQFYHNPKLDGVIGYHQLCQNLLTRWLDDVCKMYYLGTIDEYRTYGSRVKLLPIYMIIDSAAADLIQECMFFFSDRIDIRPVKKPTIMEMVAAVQSAICNDNIVVVDYGGYFNYTKNQFIKTDMPILAEQLTTLIWNEKQTGYDDIIENDVADSFTYPTYTWFINPENMQWFNIVKNNHIQNILIRDIINNKEAI